MPTLREANLWGRIAYLSSIIWMAGAFLITIVWVVSGHVVSEPEFRIISGLAIVPSIVLVGGMNVAPAILPFRWLFAVPPPQAVLTSETLELQLPRTGAISFPWAKVQALAPEGSDHIANLIGRNGEVLAELPQCLLVGRRRTLAQTVTEYRPDLYVVGPGRIGSPPRTFSPREAVVGEHSDVARKQTQES